LDTGHGDFHGGNFICASALSINPLAADKNGSAESFFSSAALKFVGPLYLLDGTPSTKTIEGPNGLVEQVYTSTWEGTSR
jgi:hypothetical protein